MKKVLFLGAGPLQVTALKELKAMGYQVACCDFNKSAVGFSFANETHVVSTIDKEAILEVAKEFRPDAVITSTSDMPVATAAFVCERLGIEHGISYQDALCATNKYSMRERLRGFGVPIPKYYLCNNVKEFIHFFREVHGDAISKPVDNAASRGVKLVNHRCSDTELEEIFLFSQKNSRSGSVLLEELMTGQEVSVECLVYNSETSIIAITDKLLTPPPYFVELGHSEQSQLDPDTKSKIKAVARSAIRAIGIKNGCSHVEIKVTTEGPKIVEIAARLGGDFITSRLVPLSTGVNIVRESLRAELGIKPDALITKNRGSAIRFMYGKPGILVRFDYPKELEKMSGIVELSFYKEPGEAISETRSSNDRIGHIITSGKDAAEAVLIAEKALSKITVVTR